MTRGHYFDSEGHLFKMESHLFDKEGHLFDRKGHLFREGSQFCYKLLEGRNFDYVYEPLKTVSILNYMYVWNGHPVAKGVEILFVMERVQEYFFFL